MNIGEQVMILIMLMLEINVPKLLNQNGVEINQLFNAMRKLILFNKFNI